MCLRGILPTSMEGPRAGSGYVGTRGRTNRAPRSPQQPIQRALFSHAVVCRGHFAGPPRGAVLPHSSISLAAPACRLRPQTVARSSAACVQTACVCPPHLHHRQPRMRGHIVCQDVNASSSGRAGKILPAGVSLNIYSKMLQCWTPPSLHGAIQFSPFVSVSFSV